MDFQLRLVVLNQLISGINLFNLFHAVMFQVEKVSSTFVFTVDYSKKPLWLDMIIEKDGLQAKLFGLVEFIEKDKVKIELFYGNVKDRPTLFSVIPSVKKSRVYNFTLKR